MSRPVKLFESRFYTHKTGLFHVFDIREIIIGERTVHVKTCKGFLGLDFIFFPTRYRFNYILSV